MDRGAGTVIGAGGRRVSRRAALQASAVLAATLSLAACGAATGAASAPSAAPLTSSSVAQATLATATVASAATSSAAPTPLSSALASATTASSVGATSAAVVSRSSAVAATSSALATTAATGVKLTLDAAGTQASYQVQEQLANKNFPTPAIGRTSAVTGAIVLDAAGKVVASQSTFIIDMRTLKSDQGMRDGYIQRDPLQTSQYPTATFVPKQVTGMPWPLPASGAAKFNLLGDMTVHGTIAATTWAVDATFAADKVTGTATTPFTFTEFGMSAPHTMIALSVENNGTLTLQFSATKAAN